MTEWPGEKLRLWDCVVLAGDKDPYDDLLDVLDYAEDPDTSVTLVPGDDFYVWSRDTSLMIEGDPIGHCNWIIEAPEGGGVNVWMGVDPDWNMDPITTWTSLATSLSGGRNIIPLPVEYRTFDWLAGVSGGLVLRLEVTSGAPVLSQIRLQVEPPTGLQMRVGWTWGQLTPLPHQSQSDFGTGYLATGYNHAGLSASAALDGARSGGNRPGGVGEDFGPGLHYNRYDGDVFSGGETFSYDKANSIDTTPPGSFADLQVGYKAGYWTEKPDLRVRPSNFSTGEMIIGRDYEKVTSGSSIAAYGEFVEGETVAIEWAPAGANFIYQPNLVPGYPYTFGAYIGFEETIYFADIGGWVAGPWPPPLGPTHTHLEPATYPGDIFYSVNLGTPSVGSSWTMSVSGDMLHGENPHEADPVDTRWHQWRADVQTAIRYQMPDFRYHVPAFGPDPDAVSQTDPRGGFYLIPDSGLDGSGLGVRVNFAGF